MPRPRNPNRDKAFELFKEHNGNITNRKIAEILGEKEKTISSWKSRDKWNAVLQKNDCSTANKRKRKGGAPKGNKNAKGNNGGAPKGNKNALGNPGGGAPQKNKNAVVTGEFETIYLDVLDEEEQTMFFAIDTGPRLQLEENIRLLSLRERRMLKRIQDLMNGLTEKQKRVLQERKAVKEPVEVVDEKTGDKKVVPRVKEQLVITEVEETEYRVIDDILRIEEALTRVQDKKLKAIKLKHEMEEVFEHKRTLEQTRLQIEQTRNSEELVEYDDDGFIDALNATTVEVWSDEDTDE
ncbi:phage terminase small subunit [Bacillus tianshenii]|nr:phage terminase small subunit [Bacillus tianshenii]